jgi:hypothetical protein
MGSASSSVRALHALRTRVKHHPRRTDAYLVQHCPPEARELDDLFFLGDDPGLSVSMQLQLLSCLLAWLDAEAYESA